MNTSHILAISVTPIVLISACGLVTLALYNRLGTIVARIRAFHQQKFDLLKNLSDREPQTSPFLLEMIDSQIGLITAKAKMIQQGLFCLLASIAAFLMCSLFAGASVLHEAFGIVALSSGGIGIALFMAGLGWAMRELRLSITPLEEENAFLDAVTAHYLVTSDVGGPLKIANSA